MGLNLKNAEAEAEIRGLACEMGVGLTEAVVTAVKEARARRSKAAEAEKAERLRRVYQILTEIDAAPDIDPRPGKTSWTTFMTRTACRSDGDRHLGGRYDPRSGA